MSQLTILGRVPAAQLTAHKMRKCRSCGAEVPRTLKRCPTCGQPLSVDR